MAAVPAFSLDEAALHGVWPADELAATVGAGNVSTGHAALDAELPGGGWPLGALIELLQPAPTAAVWPLLWPALAQRLGVTAGVSPAAAPSSSRRARASGHVSARTASAGARSAWSKRLVVLNPPHEPYLPAFAAAGIAAEQLLWLAPPTPAAQLWAGEQALRCQDVAALVAWLPRVRVAELRRLQQAAAQTGTLLFALRPDQRAAEATPARLRLRVSGAVAAAGRPAWQWAGEGGVTPAVVAAAQTLPQLRIDLVKRRGPPRDEPVWLPVCGAALGAAMQAALGADAMAALSLAATPGADTGDTVIALPGRSTSAARLAGLSAGRSAERPARPNTGFAAAFAVASDRVNAPYPGVASTPLRPPSLARVPQPRAGSQRSGLSPSEEPGQKGVCHALAGTSVVAA